MKRRITASPKLQRFAWWQFLLSQYEFSVERIPGEANSLPDALTREFSEVPKRERKRFKSFMFKGSWSPPASSSTDVTTVQVPASDEWINWPLQSLEDRVAWCRNITTCFPQESSSSISRLYPNLDFCVNMAGRIDCLVNNLRWTRTDVTILLHLKKVKVLDNILLTRRQLFANQLSRNY